MDLAGRTTAALVASPEESSKEGGAKAVQKDQAENLRLLGTRSHTDAQFGPDLGAELGEYAVESGRGENLPWKQAPRHHPGLTGIGRLAWFTAKLLFSSPP